MKLPQYQPGPVQTLGRDSPGAIVGAARAQQQALESIGGAVQQIYESESVSQTEKANLVYLETMDSFLRDTESYDTDDQGNIKGRIWDNPEERYQQAEKAARKEAGKLTETSMSKRLFANKADQLSVRYGSQWSNKVLTAQREDQSATMMVSYNKHVEAGRWDNARMTLIEANAVNLLNPAQFQALKAEIDYKQNYFETGELAATSITRNAEKMRQQIKDDKSFKAADSNRLLAQVDGALLEATYNDMQNVIQNEERKTDSLSAAIIAGQKQYNKLVRTPAVKLGGDEAFKMKQLTAARNVLNLYKSQMSSDKSSALRMDNLNCLRSGRCKSSPDYNQQMAEDDWAISIMGWGINGKSGYDKTQGYSDNDFVNNKDGILDQAVIQFARNGFIPKEAGALLDSTFYQGDADTPASAQQISVLRGMGRLAEMNKQAVYTGKENNRLASAVSLYQTLGTTDAAAQRAIQLTFARDQMSQADLKGYDAQARGSEYKKFADKNFDKYLKARFPDKGDIWDSTPDINSALKNRTVSLAKTYLPLTGGDQEMAMKAALYELTAEFSVSTINGDATLERFAPEKYVFNGDKFGGAWIREQASTAIKERYPDIDPDQVQIMAVSNFDPNNPAYVFIYRNPETGMSSSIGTGFRFEYEKTKEFAKEAKEIALQQQADLEMGENARMRSEWIQEHGGKNPRAFGPGGFERPFGADPSDTVGARIARGNKEMREAAKKRPTARKDMRKTAKKFFERQREKEDQVGPLF